MLEVDWHSLLSWNFSDAVEEPIYWYAIITFIVLCSLFILIRKLRKELIPVFADEEGNVQITPNALHELVRKTCAEIPGIFAPATAIKRKGNNFRLNIRIRIKQDCNIKEIRKTLRNEIETIMVENLSFTNFGGLDIIIKGFQGKV
jgi:hypothetical protein|tara:strand:+ start:169 stop:606 length:438 start_codon:yes stop_codon:yes gene_type:complete